MMFTYGGHHLLHRFLLILNIRKVGIYTMVYGNRFLNEESMSMIDGIKYIKDSFKKWLENSKKKSNTCQDKIKKNNSESIKNKYGDKIDYISDQINKAVKGLINYLNTDKDVQYKLRQELDKFYNDNRKLNNGKSFGDSNKEDYPEYIKKNPKYKLISSGTDSKMTNNFTMNFQIMEEDQEIQIIMMYAADFNYIFKTPEFEKMKEEGIKIQYHTHDGDEGSIEFFLY